jgi:hypothetical protein
MPQPPVIFVIDTEQYAGKFENKMCAYLTGWVGCTSEGAEQARAFNAEVPPAAVAELDSVLALFEDSGRPGHPVQRLPTPGWFDHGKCRHYQDTPENEIRALTNFLERSKLRDRKRLIALDACIAAAAPPADRDACARDRAAILARWTRLDAMTAPLKLAAYLSVGVAFSAKPGPALIELLKHRARKFAAEHKIVITGFRLQAHMGPQEEAC